MSEKSTSVAVPPGKLGGTAAVLDITDGQFARTRLSEVAICTMDKAQELAAVFGRGWACYSEVKARGEYELSQAKEYLERVKAVIILDRAPTLLKEKGLASAKNPLGSADVREAVIALDPEYQKAKDNLDKIEAFVAMARCRGDELRTAYHTVARVMGERPVGHNPGTIAPRPSSNVSTAPAKPGFGRAKI